MMRTPFVRFLTVGVIYSLLALPILADDEPAPADDPAPADEELKLEGTWVAESAFEAGKQTDEPVGDTAMFQGDKLTIKPKLGEGPPAMTFTVDEKTTPKQIDITLGDRQVLGVYSITGGKLHLCMAQPGEPRPEKLKSQENTKQFSLVFGRKPEAAPDGDAPEEPEQADEPEKTEE